MKTFKSRVVAITGAGFGIGRALALEVGSRGAKVAVSDVDQSGLDETVSLCETEGVEVFSSIVDVAKRQEVENWASDVESHYGQVHAIINNAGVSLTATVDEMSYEDFEWLMDINFWGVVYGTKAFLPLVRASGDGHIVNISSIFGIIAVPAQSAYNASKFAVKGFTEALAAELELEAAPVHATVVHPGGIKTGIVRRGRFSEKGMRGATQEKIAKEFEEELAITTAEAAAQVIADGIVKNKLRVMVGRDAKLVAMGQRLLPNAYLKAVIREAKKRI